MRENDVVFFNLHRRYVNTKSDYGGFLGIFLLAAFLNENGYASQSFSGELMEGKALIDSICKDGKAQLIGLYCDFENVTENIFLSKYIKENYGLPVIVGGPQATALDRDFLVSSQCDAVVRYEGELTVLELSSLLLDGSGKLENIDGIMYLDEKGEAVINKDRPLIENLDALPFITDECYLQLGNRERSLSIMTGRGCPFNCAFCHEGAHTKKVRFRSTENVISEIQAYLDAHPDLEELFIMFTDDTFTLLPDRVKTICQAIEGWQKKMAIRWFCEAHVHTLYKHPEMISYLAAAKCQRVQLGIEAGTQPVLDAFRKGSTLDEIREVVRLCEQHNIQQVYSNIILGAAFFTKDVFYRDIAFAKELLQIGKGIMELGGVSYWPLPETSITMQPEKYATHILDYEFVTSAGDYSQVCTDELGAWEISAMVQEFDKELGEYKKKMLLSGQVPHERILGWYSKQTLGRSYGRWWYAIKNIPHMDAYYTMLASDETCRSYDLTDDEYALSHPMRVFSISHSVSINREGTVKINDFVLDEFDQMLYPLCVGKLSIKEIAYRLKEKIPLSDGENFSLVKERLDKYEEAYMVVFSRY